MLKRIVLSVLGLSFLLGCYATYVSVLQNMTRLPELERAELPSQVTPVVPPQNDNRDDIRTVASTLFGDKSWQADRDSIALNWKSKGTVIFIDEYYPGNPKEMKLVPFSLVRIGDEDDGAIEYSVLSGDEAIIEFEEEVENPPFTSAPIVGGRIEGNVQVLVDNGTEDKSDDIVFYTESLRFIEAEQKIWTDQPVRIVKSDLVVDGVGLLMELTGSVSNAAQPRGSRKMKVKRAQILRDIRVRMVVSGTNELFGSKQDRTGKSKGENDKAMPITIRCAGPFVYDLRNDSVVFQNSVTVEREPEPLKKDRLYCQELHIDLEPKNSRIAKRNRAQKKKPLTIRRIRATGPSVRIVSDAKQLDAVGKELVHDARRHTTTLFGSPHVTANAGGNKLTAPKIILSSGRRGQRAIAPGPGKIEIIDEKSKKVQLIATWQGDAIVEPDGALQLVTLSKDVIASVPFQGKVNAGKVRIWTDPSKKSSSTDTLPVEISRIVAEENCRVISPRIIIDTQLIDIDYDSVSAPEVLASVEKPGLSARPKTNRQPRADHQPGRKKASSKSEKPLGPPAHLVADKVHGKAFWNGEDPDFSELVSDGNVKLTMPDEDPDVAPVVVTGTRMTVKPADDGREIEIEGSSGEKPVLARIASDQFVITGPIVGLNQSSNIAWVEGAGGMALPSTKDFEGRLLPEPQWMRIFWNQNMFFDGRVAGFSNQVHAELEGAEGENSLDCNFMEATLAEEIDLMDPDKAKGPNRQRAEIIKLFCRENVRLIKTTTEKGMFASQEQLRVSNLTFDNESGMISSVGKGEVWSYSVGKSGFGTSLSLPQSKPEDDDQLTMTRIYFSDGMEGNRKTEMGTFKGRVRVLHAPVETIEQVVDIGLTLPADAFLISAARMEMGTRKDSAGKKYRSLTGEGNVALESTDFDGKADRVTFDQLNERLVFESTRRGSLARVYRRGISDPDEYAGQKFFYYLKTQSIRVDNGMILDMNGINAGNLKSKRIK